MPTHQDETLPQRYAREHQDYLKLCGSMTAEQVADPQLQLNNSLAREQALQHRLTAADERADVLTSALEGMLEYFPEGHSDGECFSVEMAKAALKPAVGSTCNQIREETGLPINNPCHACNNGSCIDK